MSAKALLSASVSAPPAVYVEDVFSTFLYTGNGSTQTITNGIDLAGKGGLVWLKRRTSVGGTASHRLYDTNRGTYEYLQSNSAPINSNPFNSNLLSAFLSSGFTLGSEGSENGSGDTYCSWTFRKQPKFFDVVTFTCNAGPQTINHNLGSTPGMMIVKNTTLSGDWFVWHRSIPNNALALNTNQDISTYNAPAFAFGNGSTVVQPTSTQFTFYAPAAGSNTYVAYLFAHDAGGFGTAGTDNVVSCGSYTGTDTTQEITLGFEPQWLLIKRVTNAGDPYRGWTIFDNMRGMALTGVTAALIPNTADAENPPEANVAFLFPTATGFSLAGGYNRTNTSGNTYIYIAIRRGPMKTPTVGTQVFSALSTSIAANPQGFTTNFPVDFVWTRSQNIADSNPGFAQRLTNTRLVPDSTAAENATSFVAFDFNTKVTSSYNNPGFGTIQCMSAFRRAPGFFDVVCYKGDNAATRTLAHNLTVAPELIIMRMRNSGAYWYTYFNFGSTDCGIAQLESPDQASTASYSGSFSKMGGAPTSSSFFVTAPYFNATNISGLTYIAYLFATCPGVSKVGTYTGTGATKQIDCGFTAGARFVLIKRTDSTGDWYVWDTARGIISGNDPYLLLNSAAGEVTGTDYIDPLSSGFEISSTAPAAINANGGTYIFLAIA